MRYIARFDEASRLAELIRLLELRSTTVKIYQIADKLLKEELKKEMHLHIKLGIHEYNEDTRQESGSNPVGGSG